MRGGRDSEELRTAMVAADCLYSPLRASAADLWTVEHVDQLIGLAKALNPKLRSYALLTMAPTHPGVTEATDAAEMLRDFTHLPLAETIVRDRKVFRDAMCDGKGVLEMSDPKAIAEMTALTEEISRAEVQSAETPVH